MNIYIYDIYPGIYIHIIYNIFPKYDANHKGFLPCFKNCFSHPQTRNLGPFPVASHPLPRATAYLLHNKLYLAPSRWQVTL